MRTVEEDIVLMKDINRKLQQLLDDPHPGLMTWVTAVSDQLHAFNQVRTGRPYATEEYVDPSGWDLDGVEQAIKQAYDYLVQQDGDETPIAEELAGAKEYLERRKAHG